MDNFCELGAIQIHFDTMLTALETNFPLRAVMRETLHWDWCIRLSTAETISSMVLPDLLAINENTTVFLSVDENEYLTVFNTIVVQVVFKYLFGGAYFFLGKQDQTLFL